MTIRTKSPWLAVVALALLMQGCLGRTATYDIQTVLPAPTGSYAVGSRYFFLVDRDRPDLVSPDPDDYRAVSLQAWYPAKPGPGDKPILLNDRILLEGYVEEGALDSTILTEWAMEPTHSYLKARPAKAKTPFPVILYSASGVINANTFMAEELASHGYVVFAIGHPYWCEFYFDAEGKTTCSVPPPSRHLLSRESPMLINHAAARSGRPRDWALRSAGVCQPSA